VFLRVVMFTFWNYYVLKLLRLETISFSDATLSDINVMLRFVAVPFSLMIFFMPRMKQVAILVALVVCMMVHDTSAAPAPDSAMEGKLYTK